MQPVEGAGASRANRRAELATLGKDASDNSLPQTSLGADVPALGPTAADVERARASLVAARGPARGRGEHSRLQPVHLASPQRTPIVDEGIRAIQGTRAPGSSLVGSSPKHRLGALTLCARAH